MPRRVLVLVEVEVQVVVVVLSYTDYLCSKL
jgi:hypothetical protein